MKNKSSPLRVIREKCLDCCAGQTGEIRMCQSVTCPLFPFRMGKKPKGSDLDTQKPQSLKKPHNSLIEYDTETNKEEVLD